MRKSVHRPEFKAGIRCLREIREQAGLTQVELATRMRRTQTFISSAERGIRRVDIAQLWDWTHACGTNLGTLGAMIEALIVRIPPNAFKTKKPAKKPRPKGK
ncbi:MAG: helix-turn-helix transcriptional regulator [Rudaea sp.]|nr:helix-turn-helix transcriptional regulator [Rudaea sp.]